MPEGDTVLRTARRLDSVFAGEVTTHAELRWGELDGTPLLRSRTLEVRARGKHLFHRFDTGLTLHSHLRMEGSWHVQPTEGTARFGGDIRAVLATQRWMVMGIRLGMLDLVETHDEHVLVDHLGPDVLGDDWDEAVAVANLLSSPDTIGAALLEQRNLAGVGTLYCAESLFIERIQPWTPAADLTRADVIRIVRRAHRLLHANIDHAVQSTTGLRRKGHEKYVHGRSGHPCRRCGETIRIATIGTPPTDRAVFYCPCCQGGLAPTDDGRRMRPIGARARPGRPGPASGW